MLEQIAPKDVLQIVMWVGTAVFLAGVYITIIRQMRRDVNTGKEDRADIRQEFHDALDRVEARMERDIVKLEDKHERGTPAVLAHLQNIEKMVERQDERITRLYDLFAEMLASRNTRNQQQ